MCWTKIQRLALLATILALLAPASHPTGAQDQRCFAETGVCISGRFRAYWEENGGLAVFGFPITAARNEVNRDTGQTYLTQWFERNRFELHAENHPPYDVLLGRLGDDRLRQLGVDWQQLPGANGPFLNTCLQFELAQTDRLVCDQAQGIGFASYWRTHGLEFDGKQGTSYQESLALFGLPLTWPRMETNANGDRVLTQWFERARFEWHADNPREFKVLLGLLGHEIRNSVAPWPLKYFWPRIIPPGMLVQRDRSSATLSSFRLELLDPSNPQFDLTISGGLGSEADGLRGEAVTIRGQRGVAFTTGGGYSIFWAEDKQPYSIGSSGGPLDLRRVAEEFEVLDLATWRQRLAQVPIGAAALRGSIAFKPPCRIAADCTGAVSMDVIQVDDTR